MPGIDPLILCQAAQAIAGALVPEDVARKTLRALMDVSGAARGLLLLGADPVSSGSPAGGPDRSPFCPDLLAEAEGERITVRRARPFDEESALPLGILRRVERSSGCLVIDETAESTFQAEPSTTGTLPRSILGVPLVARQGLAGLAYLEAPGPAVFGPAQVEAVELCAAIAVAAAENARGQDAMALRIEELRREAVEARAQRDDAEQRLRAQERLASLGTVASGVAHEIKNPLNFVTGFAELSVGLCAELAEEIGRHRGALPPESAGYIEEIIADLAQNVAKIKEHGRRADGIVRDMLHHSRGRAGELVEIELNALVREYAQAAREAQASQTPGRAALELSLDPSAGKVRVVPEEMGRVVLNLVDNALGATRARRATAGAEYAPLVSVSTRSLGDRVEVRVRDNGTGVPAAIRDRIYRPFFTTKPAGEGTGLGLALSREIVDRHGGEIRLTTEEGDHAEFVVTFPRSAGAA